MSYWAVAQCKTQRIHLSRLLLMRLEFETYMPRFKSKAGKVLLLFPSYIFVRISEQWYPVASTPGVTRILMTGEQPTRLPEAIVNGIRKREVGGFVKVANNNAHFRKGDKVRVTRGSFEGQLGIYDGMSSHERDRVLLELLGAWISVELPSNDIAPVVELRS